MKIEELQKKIKEFYDSLDYPETKKGFDNLKNEIVDKWTTELIDVIINGDFTFDSFDEESNCIRVDELENLKLIKVNRTKYPIEEKIKYYINTSWFEENIENKINETILNELKKLNQGDKIKANLKFSGVHCNFEKLIQNDEKTLKLAFSFVLKSFEIINKIEYQKINRIQLKEKISNYCSRFNLPKNEIEYVEFKKVFDYSWKKEIQFLLFEDILTIQKKENGIHFIETDLINSPSFIFRFNYNTEIEKLNDGDKINIKCKIISIETISSSNFGKTESKFQLNFEINSFDIVEKFDEEFEIKKLEEKILKKEETETEIEMKVNEINETISTNNNINQTGKTKSLNDLLDFIIELQVLRYNSRNLNSTLNSFQNKVFNEKNLNEFNLKKEILKDYIGLEFKTICEISEIREQIIDFNLYFRNKLFFLRDSRYNKILQKEVFFLKNNSSVEISFKIKEIKDDLTIFNIQLLSIKKNNKVKLFGKFIRLEYFWLGIYLSLILYSLILFSKFNFYGVIPLLFKITLGVLFGYIINKLLIKKIDDNY